MELYEFKIGPNESIVGYCCFVLLLTNVLNLTHVTKKLLDENYIENYIFIESIGKILKVCITSDTENLDEVTNLIESITLQRKFLGLPKYRK